MIETIKQEEGQPQKAALFYTPFLSREKRWKSFRETAAGDAQKKIAAIQNKAIRETGIFFGHFFPGKIFGNVLPLINW